MSIWLTQHVRAARLALHRLAAAPVNTLLSLLAIGIALTLPAGGQMLLSNIQRMAETSSVMPQISLFMATDASATETREIESRLKNFGGVKQVQFLPREKTLARLKTSEGLRGVIEALPSNPFPDAFVVTAGDDHPEALEKLAAEFRQWPKVEHVQLDSAWLQRLDALLHLGHTAITLLGTLFGIGLVAITFNTIRMQVLVGRAEIEISQLLGASDHFIRRPFLYYGALLALGGGLVASMLVAVAALWLRSPLTELAQLYGLSLSLQPLSLRDSAMLLGSAAGLGWLGAVLSLHQYLYRP